jgi:GxxExxY protein
MATTPTQRISANEVSHAIITAAMKVHTELGPGLLESTYTACLEYELSQIGIRSATQVGLPVVYHGVKLQLGYRMDLVVEGMVIVEISPSTLYRRYIRPSYFRTLSSVVNRSDCL